MTFVPSPDDSPSAPARDTWGRVVARDKKNRTNLHWYVVRTQPHQEAMLCDLLSQTIQAKTPNILEFYCPVRTTVRQVDESKKMRTPLFCAHVFVLGTHQAITDFLLAQYPQGKVLNRRTQEFSPVGEPWVVPEGQMKAFREFNENFSDQYIILERPYIDYAFNPKTNQPNEVIRVADGPLAGREGYLTRFRGSRRLVFCMKNPLGPGELTVSIPDVWDFHVVRLHNADADRLTISTRKARALDHLMGLLQGCSYDDEQCRQMVTLIITTLLAKPSLSGLCRQLQYAHRNLSESLRQMTADEAQNLLHLIRCIKLEPDYAREHYPICSLRPFLTPTSGVSQVAGSDYALLRHHHYTECIIAQTFSEPTYFPRMGEGCPVSVSYYAHVGIMQDSQSGSCVVFTNWHPFLSEYFRTAGAANRCLVSGTTAIRHEQTGEGEAGTEHRLESFRNYAPSLYRILTDPASPVQAVESLQIGSSAMSALSITLPDVQFAHATSPMEHPQVAQAVHLLVATSLQVCREINTTTHLAIWRRLLSTVWLHN